MGRPPAVPKNNHIDEASQKNGPGTQDWEPSYKGNNRDMQNTDTQSTDSEFSCSSAGGIRSYAGSRKPIYCNAPCPETRCSAPPHHRQCRARLTASMRPHKEKAVQSDVCTASRGPSPYEPPCEPAPRMVRQHAMGGGSVLAQGGKLWSGGVHDSRFVQFHPCTERSAATLHHEQRHTSSNPPQLKPGGTSLLGEG